MNAFRGLLSLLARLMIATIFLLSAVAGKIMNFSGTVEKMAAEGVPSPTILLGGAIAFLIIGSLSSVLGYKGRFGAFLLLCFLLTAVTVSSGEDADDAEDEDAEDAEDEDGEDAEDEDAQDTEKEA